MSRIDELVARLCPDGVEYRELGEITRVVRGKRVIRKNLEDSGQYPVYQNSLKPLGYYGEANRPAGTVFVICAGAAGDIGYSAVPFWSADDCFCPETNEAVNGRYLFHVLLSMQPRLQAQVRKASIPRLSPKAIEKLRVPVPPMEVQEEVVRVLDSFAELEAELEARRRQYAYYRDKLLKFTKRDSVRWLKLGTVCQITDGDHQPPPKASEGIPFVTISSVDQFGCIDFDKASLVSLDYYNSLSRERVPLPGDVLYTVVGTLGQPVLVEADRPFVVQRHIAILRPGQEMRQRFLYHLVQKTSFYEHACAAATGAAQKTIGLRYLRNVEIPVPPLDEQDRIVETLDKFDKLVNDISRGLPAEIEARRKQYDYYRDKLLAFPEKKAA